MNILPSKSRFKNFQQIIKEKKKKKYICDLWPFPDLRICGNDQSFFAPHQCSPLVRAPAHCGHTRTAEYSAVCPLIEHLDNHVVNPQDTPHLEMSRLITRLAVNKEKPTILDLGFNSFL